MNLRQSIISVEVAEAEIIDELEAAHRDLRVQLDSGDSFGTIHSGTAWTKNQHFLVGADYDDTRRLVDEVHEQLRAMNDKTVTRYKTPVTLTSTIRSGGG